MTLYKGGKKKLYLLLFPRYFWASILEEEDSILTRRRSGYFNKKQISYFKKKKVRYLNKKKISYFKKKKISYFNKVFANFPIHEGNSSKKSFCNSFPTLEKKFQSTGSVSNSHHMLQAAKHKQISKNKEVKFKCHGQRTAGELCERIRNMLEMLLQQEMLFSWYLWIR